MIELMEAFSLLSYLKMDEQHIMIQILSESLEVELQACL
jgi:hypothetical protein